MQSKAGQIRLVRRVATTANALREVFGSTSRRRITLDPGMHSPWVSRLLSEFGQEVIVANARKVRLIGESRKQDDRLDAQTLAGLARTDPKLLCPVEQRNAQAQADLATIRARDRSGAYRAGQSRIVMFTVYLLSLHVQVNLLYDMLHA